jgi:hypothetical protein
MQSRRNFRSLSLPGLFLALFLKNDIIAMNSEQNILKLTMFLILSKLQWCKSKHQFVLEADELGPVGGRVG